MVDHKFSMEESERNIKYSMVVNEQLGRYLIAVQDLEAGEEILSMDAAVVGPKHHTPPLCLGCHARTSNLVPCSRCTWPVCGEACERLSVHRDLECAVFASARVKFPADQDPEADCPQLECITPLRLLLNTHTDKWRNEVNLMETHEKERRDSSDWKADQVNIVNFLRQYCKLADRYSEELIHQVCGILAVNAFEAHSQKGDNSLRVIYAQMSLLAHSCIPNTSHSIDKNFRVRLRTTVRVSKGEPLYTTYTHTLRGTYDRRQHLSLSKYFECKCPRCCDPTELGSHLSTFKCPKCEWGWVMAAQPLTQASDWQCSKCEYTMPNLAVVRVLNILHAELAALAPDDLETREALLRKYKASLHPRHAHMTALKLALSQLYGRVHGYTFDVMPDVLLERKIELCRHVLEVADILEPNKTRLRGTTLYELHAPLIMLARSQYQQLQDKTLLLKGMREAADILAEAVDILSLEEEHSAEGQLAIHGRLALQQLQQSLLDQQQKSI